VPAVNINTLRFGEIEIDESRIIEMPEGMLGFADRRFIILSPDNNGRFFWLQSLDSPELAFVVTDPVYFVPAYEVNLTSDEYDQIKLGPDSEAIILSVVTMAGGVTEMTLNLQGPIVVNPVNLLAKQVVLGEGKYGTKHPLFPASDAKSQLPVESDNPEPASILDRISTICCKH
jgi:flagellar assembly factor FliW